MRVLKITEHDYGQVVVETSDGKRVTSTTVQGALKKLGFAHTVDSDFNAVNLIVQMIEMRDGPSNIGTGVASA